MNVLDVMTKNPSFCTPETPLFEVAKMMKEHDCGEIPVVDKNDKKPVGVVTDRDIVCRSLAENINPLILTAHDVMTGSPMVVRPETSIEGCCEILEENQIRRVLVVDENGSLCGIVSQADIALKAPKMHTAEVVREISTANRPC